MTPILASEGLTKKFGGLTAVNDVSFEVMEHEILSIIGPNGAGKSTLFKLIASFLRPTSGRVLFRGSVISGLNPHAVARRGVVRTFQETSVFKESTALENVMIGRHLNLRATTTGAFFGTRRGRMDQAEANAAALAILDRLKLTHVRDEKAKNLPHGNLRALGVAIALAAAPQVLLLDEPFAGLNSEETDQAVAMVDGIRQSGVTILLVEHDMRAVMRISDRIIVLNFGVKIAEGAPAAIRSNDAVIEAYLGRDDKAVGV
jgi:branched-chain amino acid transport system ATP-binding protein